MLAPGTAKVDRISMAPNCGPLEGKIEVTDQNRGALSGVKVLELGRLVAAPLTGQILADLGADVLKVEHPTGDEYRKYGPVFLKTEDGEQTDQSAGYVSWNRNKSSIAVDLGSPEGAALVRELAATCDVFIENFRVGALVKYGLDFESVKKLNPSVAYLSVTGFGQDGPYAQRPATDGIIQALSGIQSLNGSPGSPPQRVGLLIFDLITGIYGAVSVLAALRHREVQHGPGQQIDLSLLDCAISALSTQALEYRIDGHVPGQYGNGQAGAVPAQAYPCKDGNLQLQAAFDTHFVRLCGALDRPELATDPRFRDRIVRVENKQALNEILYEVFAKLTVEEAYAKLSAADLICAPINDIPHALADAQVAFRGLEFSMPHSTAGTVPMVANPIRMSETPVRYERPPPQLGQDADEALGRWLGLDPQTLAHLRESKAVG
jgi:crotonobetainyl-CoA:carnitine CoA-transferase CaiB-like acyl-CoA transferase